MTAKVLLIEKEGDFLKKLQHNLLMQHLDAETIYLNDPPMAMVGDVITQRNVDVVVTNFSSNLKECHNFCRKVRNQSSTFVMFVLLIDEQNGEMAKEIKYDHQTMALSCGEKEIVAAIGRAIQVSYEVLNNPKLALLLLNLDSLPSPPSVYFDLRQQLNSPKCNAAALTKLISRDQALAARILRVANSGFYAAPRTISALKQAITLLGTDTLLCLVLATHLFDSLPLPGLKLENLWKHAIGVALMARQISKDSGSNQEQVETSGIAGLLHDLGTLVFVSNQPAEYQAMLRQTKGDEMALVKMEKDYFGIDHAELGGLVLLLWGLPDSVVNAVKHHHDYNFQFTLVTTSSTWAVAIAGWIWMLNFSNPFLTDENKEEFLNDCPFQCTAEQLDHWQSAFVQLQGQVTI